MWDTLVKGGWLMIPIAVCLLLAVAISIERLVNLRLPRYLDEELLDKIRTCLVKADFEGALQICRSKNAMFNRLMETAIIYRDLENTELRGLLEDQSRQEANVLERFLPVLRTVATVAPLLGLLGTVTGMIKVFQVLSVSGLGQANNLSGGIAEALITTAAGLLVAIPTIVLHNYYEGRANAILLALEKRVIELMLLLRSRHVVSP